MLFYQDAELRRGELYIRSVDAKLPLTPDLVHSFLRQFVLYVIILTVFWTRILTGNRSKYTIGFFPVRPTPWYKIWNVTRWMGICFGEDFSTCDVLFYFEDRTNGRRAEDLVDTSNKKVLNGRCTDISKGHLEQVFEDTFGYELGVDPLSYNGPVVQKSEQNARHDGQIIACPIARRKAGMCYQRFIENCYDGRHVEDVRVPIVGGSIPFVYLKRRPVDTRFANDNSECDLVETVEALSECEVKHLIAFSEKMGLDFGGLDVLRDRDTGKIYVVDVNKTDMGPPVPLKIVDKVRALSRLGRAFEDLIKDYAA